MSAIIRNRTIRPSNRKADFSYRVKVANVKIEDEIVIFIDHESRDFREIYICTSELFQNSDSIHFKVTEDENNIKIIWSGQKHPLKIR
mgnify:CR=1 FL=1